MFRTDLLNQQAKELCEQAASNGDALDVRSTTTEGGATILDFGTDRLGTLSGGIELSRICMSGLAQISIVPSPVAGITLPFVQVITDNPVESCMASQYAGWPFSTEQYFSMCSGPARLKRGREELLQQYELTTSAPEAVGIFESQQLPDENDLQEFAEQCSCQLSDVTVCVAKTSSLPGSMQVVARSVETAMHKLFELEFDLKKVQRAVGLAPLPPTGTDDYKSMGWTNDAILYGGDVVLWIEDEEDIKELVAKLPSSSSSDFGRPFVEIFEECDRDFYKVDRLLFSPARVTVINTSSGQTITAGKLRPDLLQSSFGLIDL